MMSHTITPSPVIEVQQATEMLPSGRSVRVYEPGNRTMYRLYPSEHIFKTNGSQTWWEASKVDLRVFHCSHFLRSGTCARGTSCNFIHADHPNGVQPPPQQSTSVPVTPNSSRGSYSTPTPTSQQSHPLHHHTMHTPHNAQPTFVVSPGNNQNHNQQTMAFSQQQQGMQPVYVVVPQGTNLENVVWISQPPSPVSSHGNMTPQACTPMGSMPSYILGQQHHQHQQGVPQSMPQQVYFVSSQGTAQTSNLQFQNMNISPQH
eukprot:PhM_4_TR10034/c0_g1_i5/m.38897